MSTALLPVKSRTLTAHDLRSLRQAISDPRFSTYLRRSHRNARRALDLYAWNIRAGSLLFPLLQVNEVTLRNTVSRALAAQFGEEWPYSIGFLRSLPGHARQAFERERTKVERRRGIGRASTGDVVAAQTFWFWALLLTSRFEVRVWRAEFGASFPHAPPWVRLSDVHGRVEALREVRNRIAHHEPLVRFDLPGVYQRAISIVRWISPAKAAWAADRWPLDPATLRHP